MRPWRARSRECPRCWRSGCTRRSWIVGLTKKEFLEQWTMLYADEEELGELIYKNARW
ncbi:MAG: hypothetical protein R3B48_15970 [Kofleriaceae bacterium]